MKIKISLENIYVFLLELWVLFSVLTDSTTLGELTIIPSIFFMILQRIIYVFVILKILFEFKRKDIFIILLLFLGVLTRIFSGSDTVMIISFFLAGSKNVDIDETMKKLFWMNLIGVVFITVLAQRGIIENKLMMRGLSISRYSMGFYHPNSFAGRILQTIALYMIYRGKKLNIVDAFIIGIISYWIFHITNSYTGVILIICMSGFALAIYLSEKRWFLIQPIVRFFIDKMKYIAIIVPVFVLILTLTYTGDETGLFKGTLYSRVYQTIIYFNYYGINLFGHSLELGYLTSSRSQLYTLDNAYMFLLLGYGIICFVLFIFVQVLLFRDVAKRKDYPLLLVLTVYAIYGFSETMFVRFSYNVTLLYIANVIWNETKTKSYKIEKGI